MEKSDSLHNAVHGSHMKHGVALHPSTKVPPESFDGAFTSFIHSFTGLNKQHDVSPCETAAPCVPAGACGRTACIRGMPTAAHVCYTARARCEQAWNTWCGKYHSSRVWQGGRWQIHNCR